VPPLRDLVCFHCQQAAEKYLKALLQDLGVAIPKTHELEQLLDMLLPHHPKLASLRRALQALNRYSVEYRYPGERATSRMMKAALHNAQRVRDHVRKQLGLES
jgi:HEPN domain-containing protein